MEKQFLNKRILGETEISISKRKKRIFSIMENNGKTEAYVNFKSSLKSRYVLTGLVSDLGEATDT